MVEIVRASRAELTLAEVLEILDRGGRIAISDVVLGETTEMMIREQSGTYYCDTPTKLFTHETEEGFERCLKKFRLVAPDTEETADPGETRAVSA